MNSKKVDMKKIHWIVCDEYRKFKDPKVSYIFEKALVLSIICINGGSKDKKISKEESVEILKIIDLIISIDLYQNKYDSRKHKPIIEIKGNRWKNKLFQLRNNWKWINKCEVQSTKRFLRF